MNRLVFNLGAQTELVAAICAATGGAVGMLETRRFPDGETYVRVETDCRGADVILCASLDHPDEQTLRSLLTAATLRDLGASRILLVTPYLPYMRQDCRFHPGEAVTSRYYATLLSGYFDGLLTVDPHLHRYGALGELYTIPAVSVHAAPAIGEWIREHVTEPVLIGPDSESHQWVDAVAACADAPAIVLEKVRRGDRDVTISEVDLGAHGGRQPVLLDDIISSGRTMAEAVHRVNGSGARSPVCIAIHPVFAAGAVEDLRAAGAGRVVSCNTIEHDTNAIDVMPLIAAACHDFLSPAEDAAPGP